MPLLGDFEYGPSPTAPSPPKPPPTPPTPQSPTPPIDPDQPPKPPAPSPIPPIPNQPLPPPPTPPDNAPPPKPPQSYVPPPPPHYSHWGKRPWGAGAIENHPAIVNTAMMPTESESYGFIWKAGQNLKNFGSPSVGGLAGIASALAHLIGPFANFYSRGAFNKNYDANFARVAGRNRESYEIARQQMMDNIEDAIRANQEIASRYSDIITAWKNGGLDDNEAADEIRTIAQGDNDGLLIRTLADYNLLGVENLLASREQQIHTLWNSYATNKSADKKSGKAAADEKADTWGPGGDASGQKLRPGERPLPGMGSQKTQAPETSEETLSDYNRQLAKDKGLSPEGVIAAQETALDGHPQGMTQNEMRMTHPQKYNQLVDAANKINNDISRAASGPGDASQKLEEIRKINPNYASGVEGLLNYTSDPKATENKKFVPLAHQVKSGPDGYNEGAYRAAQEYYDEKARPRIILERVGALAPAALRALQFANAMPEDSNITANQIKEIAAGRWTGDPKWSDLYNALRFFGTEAVSVAFGNTQPRVTAIHDFLEHAPPTASPAQIRGLLQTDLINARAMADEINSGWKNTTKLDNNAPGFNEKANDIITYGSLMNHYTGQMPKNSPDELKAISKKPDPKHMPSWIKGNPEFIAPPPPTPEDAEALIWSRAHLDDPRAKAIIDSRKNW